MTELLAFNKWSTAGIVVEDPGLKNYIQLQARIVPKTGAKYAGKRFHKSRVFIVERLINKLMVTGHKNKQHVMSSGHDTGKAGRAFDIVFKALNIIEERTKENPIKIFVKAIEMGAPREEVISVEYGGARYPKAVEMAPQRRVDTCLRLFAQGARQGSFKKKKNVEVALADQILECYKSSPNSLAISKKHDLERQADSSR